jgi:predicted enzyme related to lactoylglutathione lyase
MTITNVFAELTVADFDAAIAWYGRLFGRPADRRPMYGLADWQITETGGVQVFRDPTRAGKGLLTLVVDDLPRQVEDLTSRGLAAGAIERGTAVQFASIVDPEGNTITFAAPLPDADG